jgi:DNA-binding winged helix-turn-helix (wHTH) protein
LQQPFRVGEHFLVEPPLNRVTGPRGVSRLEPKVMVVLVCLAEHAGKMVPKNRLLQAAWPDTAVSDDVLTRAISELRRLFEDDSKQPHTIETIAKGGYRLIAPVGVVAPQVGPLWAAAGELVPDRVPAAATAAASPGQSLPQPSRRAAFGAVGAAAVVLLALAGAWQLRGRPTTPVTSVPAMRVVALTAMSGSEYGPSFSPDGRQVAFGWNGENSAPGTRAWWEGNWDIYVKLVGSSEVRQLTTGPGVDLAPAWSPDGRQIAYVRLGPPSPRIRVVSSLGGSDRQVSDFPAVVPASWSPDGRYIVAGRARVPGPGEATNGIYLIPVHGATRA